MTRGSRRSLEKKVDELESDVADGAVVDRAELDGFTDEELEGLDRRHEELKASLAPFTPGVDAEDFDVDAPDQ